MPGFEPFATGLAGILAVRHIENPALDYPIPDIECMARYWPGVTPKRRRKASPR